MCVVVDSHSVVAGSHSNNEQPDVPSPSLKSRRSAQPSVGAAISREKWQCENSNVRYNEQRLFRA
ncbi:MAG: hypothetical protein ACO2PK_12325 [Armatimonadota bacterium]